MIENKVGILENLSTEEKSTVVAAINELFDKNSDFVKKDDFDIVSEKINSLNLYAYKSLGDNYTMTATDFDKVGFYLAGSLADTVTSEGVKNIPENNVGDYKMLALNQNKNFQTLLMTSPRYNNEFYIGRFWNTNWVGWTRILTTTDLYNENLLFNSYFGKLINQRGKVRYNGRNKYTFDRWFIDSSNGGGLVEQGATRMNLYNNAGSEYLELTQRLELGTIQAGKTYTFSTCTQVDRNIDVKFTGRTSKTVQITSALSFIYTAAETYDAITLRYTGYSYFIEWVKLEEGAIKTKYIRPDPDVELLKCQRYCFTFLDSEGLYAPTLGYGYTDNQTKARMSFPTPIRMRTVPTLTFQSGSLESLKIYFNDHIYNILSIIDVMVENNQVFIIFETENTNTHNHVCLARCVSSAFPVLDAEIY